MKATFESETCKYITETDYAIHRVRTTNGCPMHTHGYVEIVYTLHGKVRHTVDGEFYTVGRGDILLVNYGSTHSVEPLGIAEYFDIMLKPEFLDERLRGTNDAFLLLGSEDFKVFSEKIEKERRLVHFEGDARKRIESLIDMTVAEQSDVRSGGELMRRSALNILLGLVFRNMGSESAESGRMYIDEHLISYVEKHCYEHLTMEEMARRCFYSKEHFCRSFKKYTGKKFSSYLNSCRIKMAKELLETTDKPVEDIFLECGFSNRTGFFRSFLSETGMTPLKYRKISKKGTF